MRPNQNDLISSLLNPNAKVQRDVSPQLQQLQQSPNNFAAFNPYLNQFDIQRLLYLNQAGWMGDFSRVLMGTNPFGLGSQLIQPQPIRPSQLSSQLGNSFSGTTTTTTSTTGPTTFANVNSTGDGLLFPESLMSQLQLPVGSEAEKSLIV